MNIDRLNKAVQFAIDEHVMRSLGKSNENTVHWNQDVWGRGTVTSEVVDLGIYKYNVVCTSGCCLAGAVAHGEGDKFVVPADSAYGVGVTTSTEHCVDQKGRVHDISERACALLEIDSPYTDEGDLFDGDNEIDDVIRIARYVAEEHGQVLTIDTQALDSLPDREGVVAGARD